MDSRQVRIELSTKDAQFAHINIPSLLVPVDLRRYGLSEIVNQVLRETVSELDEKPILFDFLIDQQILAKSLDDYLIQHGLSSETTLSLEYARSILPPSFTASYPHDDWVSSVDTVKTPAAAEQEIIVTGSYDGIVRLWDQSAQVKRQFVGHNAAVKAVAWTGGAKLASAGADANICLWNSDKSKSNVSALLRGHTASVDDLAYNAQTHRLLSASADGTIRVWSTNVKEMPDYEAASNGVSGNTASNKRRKLAADSLPAGRHKGSLATLEGHTGPVTGVAMHGHDSQTAYSVSQDHTLQTWDLATGTCINRMVTSFPLLAVTTLGHLVVCGSSARHISLHDPRSHTTTQAQLTGHKNFVVSLARAPNNSQTFASGSHDGTVKIWDVRAPLKSVYTILRQSGETSAVYGVDWHHQLGVLSGGQDKKLQINEASY